MTDTTSKQDRAECDRVSLSEFLRALDGCGMPSLVLRLANRDEARSLAALLLDDDEDARREFGNSVERLAAYLRSLAVPQVARARELLPNEQRDMARAQALLAEAKRATARRSAAAPTPTMRQRLRVAAPPSVGLSAAQHGPEWGSIDALAESLGVRVPLLRLPRVRAVLASMGVEPEEREGREVWPLRALRNADDVRTALVRAAASGVAINSGSAVHVVSDRGTARASRR